MSSILRVSVPGSDTMQMAMMQNMLKAADPTIVDGPRSPVKNEFVNISMTLSRISGADEPRAMSVRFATVAFQTWGRERSSDATVARGRRGRRGRGRGRRAL